MKCVDKIWFLSNLQELQVWKSSSHQFELLVWSYMRQNGIIQYQIENYIGCYAGIHYCNKNNADWVKALILVHILDLNDPILPPGVTIFQQKSWWILVYSSMPVSDLWRNEISKDEVKLYIRAAWNNKSTGFV